MFSLPELVWYGYGSLMIYSSEMDACKNSEDSTQKLLILTSYGLVVYTYAVYLSIIIVGIVFFCAYRIFKKAAISNSNRIRKSNYLVRFLSLVPLINSLDFVAFHRLKVKP